MAQEQSGTPERQLLNLIEKPNAPDISKKEKKRKSRSFFSLAALKGRFSFLKGSLKPKITSRKSPITVRGINLILKVCIVCLIIYLGIDISNLMINLKEIPDLSVNVPPVKSRQTAEASVVLKDMSHYLGKAKARDIFNFGKLTVEEKVQEEPKEVKPPKEEPKINDVIKNLVLVGISWSDDPDAMIEDTKAKKVYFLKSGQFIEGVIQVKDIMRDRVILLHNNEEAEIR